MNAIAIQKRQIREEVRARVAKVSPGENAVLSTGAQDRLLQRPEWQRARTILGYLPLQFELDLSAVLEAALRARKTVALPRFIPERGQYCAAVVVGSLAGLPRGAFGIPEPPVSSPVLPLNRLDFALVPGVAFDPGGRRLGRGKGFYDRLLAEATGAECMKCGVALDEQIVNAIPSEPHDVVMNFILTPTRWLAVPRASC